MVKKITDASFTVFFQNSQLYSTTRKSAEEPLCHRKSTGEKRRSCKKSNSQKTSIIVTKTNRLPNFAGKEFAVQYFKDEDSNTPLHIAVVDDQLPIADYLITLPKHPHHLHVACFQNSLGFTALHYAILRKNKSIIRLLIDHHPETISIKTHLNFSSLDFAALKQNLIIFEMLSDEHFKGLNLKQKITILFQHQLKVVKRLIEYFPEILTDRFPFSPPTLLNALLENDYPSPKLTGYLLEEFNINPIISKKKIKPAISSEKKSFIAYLKKITTIAAAGHFRWKDETSRHEIIQLLFYYIESQLSIKLKNHPTINALLKSLIKIEAKLKKSSLQNSAIVVIALSRYLQEGVDGLQTYLEGSMGPQLPYETRLAFLERYNHFYSPLAGILIPYARDGLYEGLYHFRKNIRPTVDCRNNINPELNIAHKPGADFYTHTDRVKSANDVQKVDTDPALRA